MGDQDTEGMYSIKLNVKFTQMNQKHVLIITITGVGFI